MTQTTRNCGRPRSELHRRLDLCPEDQCRLGMVEADRLRGIGQVVGQGETHNLRLDVQCLRRAAPAWPVDHCAYAPLLLRSRSIEPKLDRRFFGLSFRIRIG